MGDDQLEKRQSKCPLVVLETRLFQRVTELQDNLSVDVVELRENEDHKKLRNLARAIRSSAKAYREASHDYTARLLERGRPTEANIPRDDRCDRMKDVNEAITAINLYLEELGHERTNSQLSVTNLTLQLEQIEQSVAQESFENFAHCQAPLSGAGRSPHENTRMWRTQSCPTATMSIFK